MEMEGKISLEDLPSIVSHLSDEVVSLRYLIQDHFDKEPLENRWLSIEQLCEYLPGNPAKATIYTKVQKRTIPHKKVAKRLVFHKGEIDEWLMSQSRKTVNEISQEVEQNLTKGVRND